MEEQIISIVDRFIRQSQAGLDKENPKFDFKREWYNLKNEEEIVEFLKDVTSIANTIGLDGYIVIGFDDKTKQFYQSSFINSGLKDTNELTGILTKRVDGNIIVNEFDIEMEGNSISILHIPPSFDKPHVIRSYRDKNGKDELQKIWVRSGTIKKIAGKYDLDLMYYDRKNIQPDYDLRLSSAVFSYAYNVIPDAYGLHVNLTIENTGRRTAAIYQIDFDIEFSDENPSRMIFTCGFIKSDKAQTNIKIDNLLIGSNEIKKFPRLIFKPNDPQNSGLRPAMSFNKKIRNIEKIKAVLYLSNGNRIQEFVHLIKN